jgi:Fe-S cluster assembly iron-binding protein IscA
MDIDIDFADRTKALEHFSPITAVIKEQDGTLKKHNTGVYCTSIPYNPLTGTASIDYKTAEERGYFKIDFLNASVYQGIRNEQHLNELLDMEPLWDLLEQDEFTNLLFHLNGHGNILRTLKPKNVEQLAAVLALIRPAKRYLINKSWDQILKEVWIKPDNNEYFFKKAHSFSYAMAIIVQMNLICEQLSYGYS